MVVVDELCDMMIMNEVGTFPSHIGCSRRAKSCDLVKMLCQLLVVDLR